MPEALVFFDLDGTLLTKDGQVAESSLQAINQLRDNNIVPIVATGRTVCEIEHILKQTGISSIVAMNGQYVMYEQQQVFVNEMDKNSIAKLHQLAIEQSVDLAFYNEAQMRITLDSPIVKVLYQYLHAKSLPEVDPYFYLKQPIYMSLMICTEGEELFREQFPEFTFIRNTPYCVDVFNLGGSKAFGIKQLIEKMQFQGVPTYAFGDGMNDLEMFKLVDHPIAMDNAVQPLKDIAQFVTTDNNNDGIFNGLQQLALVN